MRIRLSNTFGATAMAIGHASVAVQAGGDATPVPGPFTAQGNFIATGDQTLSSSNADFSADNPCWMFVNGVDVRSAGPVLGSVVALGDSITDTSATTGNANHRWPDYLATRLNARRGPTLSVVNAGLGGNRVLAPREGEPYWGVPALARLERDVYPQTGARDVILFEGVNDIGYDATAEQLIAGFQQIAAQTHAQGLRIFVGTVTQFKGSFVWTEPRAATWRALNTWIRTSGQFDGAFDFAAALADAVDVGRLIAAAL